MQTLPSIFTHMKVKLLLPIAARKQIEMLEKQTQSDDVDAKLEDMRKSLKSLEEAHGELVKESTRALLPSTSK